MLSFFFFVTLLNGSSCNNRSPAWLENWPRRIKAPAGARTGWKATVKIRRNPPLQILPLIQIFYYYKQSGSTLRKALFNLWVGTNHLSIVFLNNNPQPLNTRLSVVSLKISFNPSPQALYSIFKQKMFPQHNKKVYNKNF